MNRRNFIKSIVAGISTLSSVFVVGKELKCKKQDVECLANNDENGTFKIREKPIYCLYN
jgi:hypothetical protein